MKHSGRTGAVARVIAAWRGEVSAASLAAFRDAGQEVYAMAADVDLDGDASVGEVSIGDRGRRVAVWNALVPQVFAEALLDGADSAAPHAAGYLAPQTAEQVGRLFAIVEPWLAYAHRAQADPQFNLAAEVALPALLPEWVDDRQRPLAQLTAMADASRRIGGFAAARLNDAEGDPHMHGKLPRLRQLWAEADGVTGFAESLLRPHADWALRDAVDEKLRHAIELWYLFGQLAADPRLRDHPVPLPHRARMSRRPAGHDARLLPGSARFDPWCLTDPALREQWRRDRRAVSAIERLWARDPDPAATLAIQDQIEQALAFGEIASAARGAGRRLGHFQRCPWGAVYEVRSPLRLAGIRLHAMERFVFDVGDNDYGRFVRRILRGPFAEHGVIDYGDGHPM